MSKTIIAQGKTSTEAIEKGLMELGTTKENVEIRILEEEKKSFFSILTPRVVRVEMTLKENKVQNEIKKEKKPLEQKEIKLSDEDFEKAKSNVIKFLDEFIKTANESIEYKIENNNGIIEIEMSGEQTGHLIGYRGETLYAMQTILTAVANKETSNRVILRLDIGNYKSKREETLKNLAKRNAQKVIKYGKSVTLEPMQAYERKIIHSALQDYDKITTHSIGEEPRRRIVISLNK
ncbi:MAG: protein jag [Clostridia bacterium]|nr:protein jag [Clostridia bacterium]